MALGRALAVCLFAAVFVIGCGGSSFTASSAGDGGDASAGSNDGGADGRATDGGTLGTDSAIADGAQTDAFDDAGVPCGEATILHPGTETRNLGTAVPFYGRARDESCNAILGNKLVWTDNLEGQIGTGETFTHTFTLAGSHTVTLTATAQGRTYTATVTFLIV